MKKLVNALGNTILTILVLILIVYGYIFFETKIMLKKYPELFGYGFYLVNNDQMAPDFYTNDIVIIKNKKTSPGDIVMYLNNNGKFKFNRMSTNQNGIITLIDNIDEDKTKDIETNKVTGIVIGKIAYIGVIITKLQNKLVLLIIGIIGFTLVCLSQLFKNQNPEIKIKEEEVNLNDTNIDINNDEI